LLEKNLQDFNSLNLWRTLSDGLGLE